MKISTTPTNYIVIKAHTASEWDGCDFAIVMLSEHYLSLLEQRINKAAAFKEEMSFEHLTYWDSPDGWFVADDEEDQWDIISSIQGSWAFVDLDEDAIEKFVKPEQDIDTSNIRIHDDGTIQFFAHAKHTSEEFWTDSVDGLDLLKRFKQTL
jgi:hypothetical protein